MLRDEGVGVSETVSIGVAIDGRELSELVRPVELPAATEEGSPNIAGAYGGIPAWRFRGKPGGTATAHFLGAHESHMHCGPHEKTVLLACTCGEPGCWPLMARVVVTNDEVRWHDFEQPHRRGRWTYEKFGPFRFSRRQYEEALAELERQLPNDGRG